MVKSKSDIIHALKEQILPLETFKTANSFQPDIGLGPLKSAFPKHHFPLGVIHEFIYASPENAAATGGFVSGLVGALMKNSGAAIWINNGHKIFPPALAAFGIAVEKMIFIRLKNQKESLWVMEEALKCDALSAVVGEIPELSFTNSRRLQLAVEKSKVTGFVLRNNPRSENVTACTTRWKISALPGQPVAMPGVGFPQWNVDLLKVRNGRPGKWEVEFYNGRFRTISKVAAILHPQKVKAG